MRIYSILLACLLAGCALPPASKQAKQDSATLTKSNAAETQTTSALKTNNDALKTHVTAASDLADRIDAKDQVLLKAKWVP